MPTEKTPFSDLVRQLEWVDAHEWLVNNPDHKEAFIDDVRFVETDSND